MTAVETHGRKRSSSNRSPLPSKRAKATRYTIDKTWVSATGTKNYLMKDGILDFLETYLKPFSSRRVQKLPTFEQDLIASLQKLAPVVPKTTKPAAPPIPSDTNEADITPEKTEDLFKGTDMTKFLMRQGTHFEEELVKYLEKKGAPVTRIGGTFRNCDTIELFEKTVDAMKRGAPIIHGGVLHDPNLRLKGIPDLLVRSDCFQWILETPQGKYPALEVKAPICPGSYHYRVIDIKWMAIPLTADGIHVLNERLIPAYKGQLWVYNTLLGSIQGYQPPVAYLMGRRWKCREVTGETATEKLGHVDFSGHDSQFNQLTPRAIEWVRKVRQEGSQWNLLQSPLPHPELYPNMGSQFDNSWHPVKEVIANHIGEITQIWGCGLRERERAHAASVYSWHSLEFDVNLLGIANPERRTLIEDFLDVAHGLNSLDEKQVILRPSEALLQWLQPKANRLEIFIDFEGVNRCIQDFSKLPACVTLSMIFWIGISYFDPNTHKWIYAYFATDYLTLKEEERICRGASTFIQNLQVSTKATETLIYHWSGAEKTMWDQAFDRIERSDYSTIGSRRSLRRDFERVEADWFDLRDAFMKGRIIVAGSRNFGLKEIAKTFHSHGLISMTWDNSEMCPSGLLASVTTQLMAREGRALSEMPFFEKIRRYNEADCQVMAEMVVALRKFL